MIYLDKIERRCREVIANGYGKHPVIECASAECVMELITRLRQVEKDAARWRFLADSPNSSLTLRIHNSRCDQRDKVIDEAMK